MFLHLWMEMQEQQCARMVGWTWEQEDMAPTQGGAVKHPTNTCTESGTLLFPTHSMAYASRALLPALIA